MSDTTVATGTDFGRWLKQRRKEFDLTQQVLADRVGCSPDMVRKIEAGERRPSKQIAALLAEALAVPEAERTAFILRARVEPPATNGPSTRAVSPDVAVSFGLNGSSDHDRIPSGSTAEEEAVLLNPYKGLSAFGEEDAPDFFGREVSVERLLTRLAEPGRCNRFLAVVGPSGSGKSSLVQAGLLPALRVSGLGGGNRPIFVHMVPGAHPHEELRRALQPLLAQPLSNQEPGGSANGSSGPRLDFTAGSEGDTFSLLKNAERVLSDSSSSGTALLLFIDQFEELFTLTEDEAARASFVAGIYRAATAPGGRVWVIVTLRADFYDRPLLYPGMSELFAERTLAVGPMTPRELHSAITGPAHRAGLELEEGLVDLIERDVAGQPGALPLLQYALTELFERRTGRTLTVQAYRDSGGVLQAVGMRAEATYARMSTAQQEEARQIFLRLVAPGDDGGETRRAELASASLDEDALDAVLDLFGGCRLLTFDRDPTTHGPTVEVAHEALLRVWPRLRLWLDAGRENLRVQRQLMAAAREWTSSGRDPSFLARGARLLQFDSGRSRTGTGLHRHGPRAGDVQGSRL